ncbi:MAG TPA: septum formation initiator [Acetobacteraceae bacterium]|nr:septum formation initiator [Acetobacteraceae bacterium]
MTFAFRCLIVAGLVLGLLSTAHSQEAADTPPTHSETAKDNAREPAKLPPEQTTHHVVELPGRTLKFTATAGAIRLSNDANEPQADVAYIAYQLEGADRTTRPVTFAFNGGPGMASGWLQVGAIGPWRISIGGANGVPSAAPGPQPNADTWLDFTDLVFVDPPGTGYSRILGKGDAARRRLWSVNGDIDALAETVRRWLDHAGRIVSPKYILGESYGGFRGPRLVRALQSDHGVGVTGLVLISPLLDVHVMSGYNDPLSWEALLPSEVAAARALRGPVTRADLADVEQYAETDYLADMMRGFHDAAAVARITERVAALTGIDRAVVARGGGRLDRDVFLHELERAQGRVGSLYDATVTRTDPFPRDVLSDYPDPILEGLKAPVTSAMVAIYTDQLNWRPDGVYQLSNDDASRQWNWGRGMGRPESLSRLQAALALDPRLHVLIAHGLFDLVTPYFATVRELNQLPDAASAERVRLVVYPGGHMFYSEDASRAAFREAVSALFRGP